MEKWEMGDPERVAIRRESVRQRCEKACGSCMHRAEKIIGREVVPVCQFRRRVYGVRCDLYKQNTEVRWDELCK